MSLATQQLPEDLEALRAFAASLQTELARKELEIAANAAEIHAKTLHIEKLKMQLAALRRARFGRSSETLDHEIEQLELLIGELEENVAADEPRARTPDPATGGDPAQPVHPRSRRQPVRTPLPSHLPRQTVVHEPPCSCAGCGGTTFSRIGADEREVLEYVPASFKVIEGVELDRATLADWVGQAEFLLAPLAEAIGRHARAGPVLHADDGSHRASAMGARHHRPSAGARPRQDQDRTIVGGRGGREALGIGRAAGSVLSLLARPQGHPCQSAARPLPRLPACRWL